MENNRGILSHFSGLIRLIIAVALVAIIAFFLISWVRNRSNTKNAQRASQTAQTRNSNTNNEVKNTEDNQTDNSSDTGVTPIPSGVADSGQPTSSGNQNVPSAGMETNLLLTGFMLSLVTYFLVKNTAARKN